VSIQLRTNFSYVTCCLCFSIYQKDTLTLHYTFTTWTFFFLAILSLKYQNLKSTSLDLHQNFDLFTLPETNNSFVVHAHLPFSLAFFKILGFVFVHFCPVYPGNRTLSDTCNLKYFFNINT